MTAGLRRQLEDAIVATPPSPKPGDSPDVLATRANDAAMYTRQEASRATILLQEGQIRPTKELKEKERFLRQL